MKFQSLNKWSVFTIHSSSLHDFSKIYQIDKQFKRGRLIKTLLQDLFHLFILFSKVNIQLCENLQIIVHVYTRLLTPIDAPHVGQ